MNIYHYLAVDTLDIYIYHYLAVDTLDISSTICHMTVDTLDIISPI